MSKLGERLSAIRAEIRQLDDEIDFYEEMKDWADPDSFEPAYDLSTLLTNRRELLDYYEALDSLENEAL